MNENKILVLASIAEEISELSEDFVFDALDLYDDYDYTVAKIASPMLEELYWNDFSEDDGKLVFELVEEKIASFLIPIIKTANPEKYKHINFKPTPAMRAAAKRGLELRRKNNGKGGLNAQQAKQNGVGSGVARARDIIDGGNLSPSSVKRMHAFFSRHNSNIEKAKKLKGLEKAKSRAYIAALLWGGSAGKSWSSKIVRQMQAADKKK